MFENDHAYGTIIDHIEEFRTRLIRCIICVCIMMPIGWSLSPLFIDWIAKELCPPELGTLYYTAPMELFFLRVKFSAIFSIGVTLPFIMYHIWQYISPGLLRYEKKAVKISCGFSFLLFLCGAALGLFGVFPILMYYALSMQTENIKPLFSVNSCLSMSAWLMLGFGICFQLPIILLGLVRFGIVSVKTLRHSRPYIVLGIFIVAAILTPPDIISQLSMAIPTWLLYEVSLVIGGKIIPEQKKYKY